MENIIDTIKKIKKTQWTGIGVILFFIFLLVFRFYIKPMIQNQPKINQKVFSHFRAIENHCRQCLLSFNNNQYEFDRCTKVLELSEKSAHGARGGIYYVKDYYNDLKKLGFSLPPLYVEKNKGQ